MIDFIVKPDSAFYELQNLDQLKSQFDGIEFSRVQSITLGKNSYSEGACRWLAENVIQKCVNLKVANFEDMFTQRTNEEIPDSLTHLTTALRFSATLAHLNLSHNAIGLQAVNAITEFLQTCSTLKVLNISNCGMDIEVGQILARAMSQNANLKLEEFYAGRQRLENEGI